MYGTNHPVQVSTILAGPFMDPDGMDNPAYDGNCESSNAYYNVNFDNGIVDDERLGLARFMVQSNNNSAVSDPETAEQYYQVFRGYWKDGLRVMYGGNGYSGDGVVGPECDFMFPGNSDPCNYGTNGVLPNGGYNVNGNFWTEETAGNAPQDRRGLEAVGPFTFEPGTMQPLDFAMTTVWKAERESALDRVEPVIIEVIAKFLSDYNLVSVAEHYEQEESFLKVYPNPSEGAVTVEGTGKLMVVNALGQQVLTRDINGQTTLTLPSGLYFVRVDGEKGVSVNKVVVK